MIKNRILAIILIAGALLSTQAFCQDMTDNEDAATVSGKVFKVDVEGGVVYVKIDDKIEKFYLKTESRLYMTTRVMSSIEIKGRDRVTIQYLTSEGKNFVISLTDTRDE